MIRTEAVIAVVTLLAPAMALARTDKPAARDSAAVWGCIKTKTGRHWNWENCLLQRAGVGDDILHETFRRLRDKLDYKQQRKRSDLQRAWIAFLWDYFKGVMAKPMIAAF